MNRFLTKFAGTIPNRQTQQVIKILNKRRQQGDFKTLMEFQKGFESLMSELTQENLIPSLKQYGSLPFQEASTETHNEMLSRTSNDLIASFEELDKIREVQTNHETIVHEVLLKNLRSALSELQARVSIYEFLNKNPSGFELANYSTFKETQENRTNRSTETPSILFTDPKNNKFFLPKYDAEVDLIGERLVLSTVTKRETKIEEVEQTFGPEFEQSSFEITEESTDNIQNIIDQKFGTFWIKSLYQNHQNGVSVQLKLNLAGFREFNYLQFESALIRPIRLKKISWVNHSLGLTELVVNEEIKGIRKILFSKISTDTVYLDFLIPDALQFQDENINHSDVNILREIVSPGVAEAILDSGAVEYDPQQGYKYQIGFDNIRLGSINYTDKSVYVSQPLTVEPDNPEEEATEMSAILGLKAISKRPYILGEEVKYTELVEENFNFLGSIEYWVIKKDLQADGTVVKTSTFPMLPMGTKEIKHERLVFSKDTGEGNNLNMKNSGRLCFMPDLKKDIKIYANGTEFYTVTGGGGNTARYDEINSKVIPNVGSPMCYYLKISKEDINLGDIYTVSYTPLFSDSYSSQYSVGTNNPIDWSGNMSIRSITEQMVLLNDASDINIAKYELYLMVILRQNTADSSTSPAVEEYTLALGQKDLLKFEEQNGL
jgi:hypothetical protein